MIKVDTKAVTTVTAKFAIFEIASRLNLNLNIVKG